MTRIAALALLLLPSAGLSHPHVFVDASAGMSFDAQGRLAGLRILWRYDAMTTLNLYVQLGLDADGDGALDAADLARVAQGETDWPPDYEGDTYLYQDGAKVPLGRPQNAEARMVGDRVEVVFDLPLAEPIAVSEGVALKLYDPSYFYAYTVQETLDSAALPAGCAADVIPFKPSAADAALQADLAALSAEQIPDDPQIGARFADEVHVSCD
jgi:ABC-type uncharacterized transport system substrate-binding protein